MIRLSRIQIVYLTCSNIIKNEIQELPAPAPDPGLKVSGVCVGQPAPVAVPPHPEVVWAVPLLPLLAHVVLGEGHHRLGGLVGHYPDRELACHLAGAGWRAGSRQ